ncbi:MAG TPA: hypothetical protein VJR89_08475 [Polyangiales bacterium]|nr:hypothetical protein [Polyangiales bacterium]
MAAEDSLVEDALARAAHAPHWLRDACGLEPETIGTLLPVYLPLAREIAARRTRKGATFTVGIQGPQAAGKTTLTHLLQRVLSDVAGLRVATLSIDDLYLTRAQRAELAARVHPLFITRGVPGTHDVALGVHVLASLARAGRTAVPRFDKGRDDRAPQSAWPVGEGPCDVVLFEGLWIGLPPLDDASLAAPVNALEAAEDPRAVWRTYANHALRDAYPALFAPCELLVHFQVPDFACVKRWRSGAEDQLRARLTAAGEDTSRLMDAAALERFFEHYERFSEHAMRVMPERADVILRVDSEHRVFESTL